MQQVLATPRNPDGTLPFFGAGVLVEADGTLRMTAFTRSIPLTAVWELRIQPFEVHATLTKKEDL